jgi:hypothetical protein
MTLQAADLNGLFVVMMIDAGTFTKNVHRTDPGAAGPEDVGVKNSESGAAEIALGDFFDEPRNIDVSWAGRGAGGIEAVEAAVGFS